MNVIDETPLSELPENASDYSGRCRLAAGCVLTGEARESLLRSGDASVFVVAVETPDCNRIVRQAALRKWRALILPRQLSSLQ